MIRMRCGLWNIDLDSGVQHATLGTSLKETLRGDLNLARLERRLALEHFHHYRHYVSKTSGFVFISLN